METVLGLSMTSTTVAWVLLEGSGADADTLDHDQFDVADASIDGDITRHEAAVRGAQAIAAASGHHVTSIGVTWSDAVDAKASLLLKSLPDMGFEHVTAVPLPDAARAWAQAFGRPLGFERCAVCVVEATGVRVISVLYDSVRSAVTRMRESADGIASWLVGVFEGNRSQPESLYLIGSRGDLELIAGPLEEHMPMPVVASEETQLTLARGAALGMAGGSKRLAPPTAAVDTAPGRRPLARFGPHARAATILAAGVTALFAVGPGLVDRHEPPAAEQQAAVNTSMSSAPEAGSSSTSVSVHVVPSRAEPPAAPASVQPLAAPPEPAAVPPVAEVPVAQPEVVEEPTVAVSPEPVEAQPVVAPPTPVEAVEVVGTQPVGAPLPAPVLQPPLAVQPAAAPVAPVAPLAPPPAAPVAPLAPPPVAAPPPLPPGPPVPYPAPPPDPIAAALSPLFGGLP